MPTTRIRCLAAAAGLFAAAWLAADTGAAPAAKEAAAGSLDADIAFLNAGFAKDLAGKEKRAVPTLKAAAMNVALAGSPAVREQALKVAELLGKKDFAGAKAAAAKLTAAAGSKGDPAKLAEAGKYELSDIMSAYRGEKVGGMNLEKDIKTMSKKATDAKAVELIAARSALLGEYTLVKPEGKATANAASKAKWEGFSKDQIKAAEAVAAEAAKGTGPALAKKLVALDATCVACHNEFRD